MCKLRTANVRASAMKLNSHHAFHPQGTMHAHRKGMSRVGLFAFLNYCPVRQKQRSPLGRLTKKQVRLLTSRRADFAGVLHEYGKTLMASRLNVSVPVEIELAAYGSSSILVAVFQDMAVGGINPLASPMETA